MDVSVDDFISKFMIWAIREAKIDVIDIESAIEIHGFREEDELIPVISLAELIELFKVKTAQNEIKS